MRIVLVIPKLGGNRHQLGCTARVVDAETQREIPVSDLSINMPIDGLVSLTVTIPLVEIEQIEPGEWIRRFGEMPPQFAEPR